MIVFMNFRRIFQFLISSSIVHECVHELFKDMANSSLVHERISRTVHLQKFINLTQELKSTVHELERLEKFMIS